MIKHDGVDIPRIEYIDPVDGKVSILRVMQDGVQIWPVDSGVPNIPTGIQLSEYEIIEELEIPTGITLREVMNIPTGITLREVLEPAYTYLLDDYPGAVAAYSLRKLRTGETLAIRVERDIDNTQTDVLLEDEGSITLASTVSAGGTLGAWIGSNNGFIATWYDQSGAGFDVTQSTYASMPQIISSGALLIQNGNPSIAWLSSVRTLNGATALSAIDSGNQFSMLSVANQITTGVNGAIFTTNATASSNRLVLFRDGRTSPNRNFGGASWVDLSTPRNNADQVLQFGVRDATSFYGWDNGDASPQNPLASFVYTNTDFHMGLDRGATNNFSGRSQELIIWGSDKSTDRVGIETEVNDYYNIWVITAEVDAQLIQADNDNVSDTVLEINGVRSSASDTAVANLISRNVTVITN